MIEIHRINSDDSLDVMNDILNEFFGVKEEEPKPKMSFTSEEHKALSNFAKFVINGMDTRGVKYNKDKPLISALSKLAGASKE